MLLLPAQAHAHVLASTGVSPSAARWYLAPELRLNTLEHSREIDESCRMGYVRTGAYPPPPNWTPPRVQPYYVSAASTGMGPVCPFALAAPDRAATAGLPLVFVTLDPLFSAAECQMVIEEAKALTAVGGGGSDFTLSDTSRNIAVADLPATRAWLNEVAHARLAKLAADCYGEVAIGAGSELHLYRALVVQYDAAQGLTHQQASAPSTSTAHRMSKAVSQKRQWRSPPKSRIRTAGGPGTSGLSVSDGADRRTPSSAPPPASS